jgi:hypothetical protein
MEMEEEQKFCLHIRREGKKSMKAERKKQRKLRWTRCDELWRIFCSSFAERKRNEKKL